MSSIYFPKIVTDGLVFCVDAGSRKSYPRSGTVWKDLSLRGANGTLTNGPTFNSANGGSIVFDGTNDYVTVPSSILPNELFADNLGPWSVSSWFRFPVSPGGTRTVNASWSIVGRAGGIATQGHFILFVGSATDTTYGQYAPYKVACTIRGAVTVISPSSVNNNMWNNVAITWNGSSGACYFNGNRVTLNVGAAARQTGAAYVNFMIGANSNSPTSHVFRGNIAQVAIYNRAISQAEITQNFNATRGRFGI